MKSHFPFSSRALGIARTAGLVIVAGCMSAFIARAADLPQMVDANLGVRTVVSGLTLPTSIAFLGPNDLFVLEKASGKVLRVVNGAVQSTVLDLAVNSGNNAGAERGLLGMALHPQFPAKPWVYLYWTESTTGADSTGVGDTSLLGNRVDRFTWNGATLTADINLIRMRALQVDPTNPAPRSNHNGGVLRFGPDGKLYVYTGDRGRRGQMQNLPDGPGPAGNTPDDPLGGPEPDNAHLTGVILRLNDDGTTPADNPFFSAGAKRGGEAGTNLQKVFAYGVRNGFGMAFDPKSGSLWEAQNGDDSFTELNHVEAGANLGWVQIMGPLARIAQFREIENSAQFFGLQQVRWSPANIATTPEEALKRMFHVFDGGDRFAAALVGAEENPPVTTTAGAFISLSLSGTSQLSFELRATGPIQQATMAHIHFGGYTQNGPVVVPLFAASPPRNFAAGDTIAAGTITDAMVQAVPNFTPSVANLVNRIRQGRAYANLHTSAHPGGEIRGQLTVVDREPVSHYSDPEFSWKFEVAPAALGFIDGKALGPQYDGDMIVGAARDTLLSGQLFRFRLTGNGRMITPAAPGLSDRVADNLAKFDITESESLVFGTGFGIGTDVQTGPSGNLYVVSHTHGVIYEIFRR